jgi:2-dehydro-3-deoxyphosphooctonate aldolase (KDO 8-P synthase)
MILIAGPCVLDEQAPAIADALEPIFNRYAAHFETYFKASYDKANRTSIKSYRGPGIVKGLQVLKRIKKKHRFLLTTDVHSVEEVQRAADVVDMVQIPALLCRQTDLLVAAGKCGRRVNIKKGQFMAPWDMVHAVDKVKEAGCKEQITVTERGASFGYNRLVVDLCAIPAMQAMGLTTILDCTHSLQLPAAGCGCSASQPREYARTLAWAATAAGVDGLFFEIYPDPDNAKCDGPNSLTVESFEAVLEKVVAVRQAIA